MQSGSRGFLDFSSLTSGGDSGRRKVRLLVLALMLANVGAQFVAYRARLNNDVLTASIVSAEAGPNGDALEYTSKGAALAHGESFSTVFSDGERLPGYPC